MESHTPMVQTIRPYRSHLQTSISYPSRTIENLKIQIATPFLARSHELGFPYLIACTPQSTQRGERTREDEEEGVTSSEEESGAEDGDSTVQSPNEKIAKKGDEGEIVFDPEVELKRQRKREARKAKAESKKRGDKVLTKKQKEEAERQKKYLNFQKKVLEREKEELEAKKERIVAKRVRTMKENMKLESAELLQDNLKEVVEEKLKKAVERKRQQAEKRDAPRKPPKW
eukprot:TRINITY_DN3235_c0_g1_i4.p1 TRINITY_DN3235_c0_g1~~TRINITY_DN3235_c0_g1_i4.p1  ORF type:complete len:229 (-),score=40.17 TRINITY_DN3235_c0_g1_i4:66-752(-)